MFARILHRGFFPHLDSLHYSHYTSEVSRIISVCTPCASNRDVTYFVPEYVLENWENCLGCRVGLARWNRWPCCEDLPKSWASVPVLPVCCSYFSPVLVTKELSVNWMAKTIFQAFFLNEKKPQVTILVVFIWLFSGLLPGAREPWLSDPWPVPVPLQGPAVGLAALPCPQEHVAISQANPLFSLNLIRSPHVRPQGANAQESTVISVSWDLPNPLCQFK